MEEAQGGSAAQEAAHGLRAHPGPKTYLLVAAVLTVITAAEVAVFYIEALRDVLVPILLALSAAKFSLVALFYMHLRFDSRIFSGVFLAPMLLAVLFVAVGLYLLFKVLPYYR